MARPPTFPLFVPNPPPPTPVLHTPQTLEHRLDTRTYDGRVALHVSGQRLRALQQPYMSQLVHFVRPYGLESQMLFKAGEIALAATENPARR